MLRLFYHSFKTAAIQASKRQRSGTRSSTWGGGSVRVSERGLFPAWRGPWARDPEGLGSHCPHLLKFKEPAGVWGPRGATAEEGEGPHCPGRLAPFHLHLTESCPGASFTDGHPETTGAVRVLHHPCQRTAGSSELVCYRGNVFLLCLLPF